MSEDRVRWWWWLLWVVMPSSLAVRLLNREDNWRSNKIKALAEKDENG